MSVPVLKHGAVLIATLQGALSDAELMELRDTVANRLGSLRSRALIVDLSALDVLDSFASRMLQNIAHTARLRGAETVIVGIQPDVAFAMVQLGLTLDGIDTALDFEEGMARLSETLCLPRDHAS
jgi:rsbT antagonist protein RsbS